MLHRSVDKEHWTESMKDTWQNTNLDTQNIANFINSKKKKKSCFCLNIGRKKYAP